MFVSFREFILLSSQVAPNNPSLHIHTKVSTLTSMQVPPLLQGELTQATHGSENGKYTGSNV